VKARIARELVDWLLVVGVIVACSALFAALYALGMHG
jgi:hypothetical protein